MLLVGEVKRQLGVDFSLEQIVATLSSLGFGCKPGSSAAEVMVTVPYWRSDIRLVVDLVEEIARIRGYDTIPTTMLSQPIPRQNPEPIIRLKRELRNRLSGYGFQELVTYSLTSLEMLTRLLPEAHSFEPMPLRVANPMSAELEYLRPNLRANLLAALALNRRHEDGAIKLFELGRVYHPRSGDLPLEPETLCGLLSGAKIRNSWQGGDKAVDFFETKGVVEGLLQQLGVTASFESGSDEGLHAAKQAAIVIRDSRVGVVGELHPKVLENFEISEAAYLFEIDLATLLPFTI
ncbi:MAG: phenylalanine--tRNA ligase subunit beta, partial [Chloroflexi bacterium]|nr:phenylalanine--tRNA ligase subunit beta [Chloroflexota bacterium]